MSSVISILIFFRNIPLLHYYHHSKKDQLLFRYFIEVDSLPCSLRSSVVVVNDVFRSILGPLQLMHVSDVQDLVHDILREDGL